MIIGIHVARVVHQPPAITVQITPQTEKPKDAPPPPRPQLVQPATITAPVPDVKITPLSTMVTAAPPITKPAPPPPPPPVLSTAAPTWQGLLLGR